MHPHERKSVTPCVFTHLALAIRPHISDNHGVQLPRRGFLWLIATLPAALTVFRSLPVQATPAHKVITAVDWNTDVRRNLSDISRSTFGPWQAQPFNGMDREKAIRALQAEI